MSMLNEQNLLLFLEEVDVLFPIPLSHKASLPVYAKKLLENATICADFSGDRIVGLAAGYTENLVDGIAYMPLAGVVKDFQNKGIARKLFFAFFRECQKKKIAKVHWYTDPRNFAAIRFYESLGFKTCDTVDPSRQGDIHYLVEIDKILIQ